MSSKLYLDREEEILKLASRRKIYALVKEFSGCNFRDLERKSNIPTGTLQYHLHYLTKHEIITTQKDGNKIRYFAKNLTSRDKVLLSFLRQKNIRRLVLFILEKKECNWQEILQSLQVSPSTVSWYLSRLVEQGVLTLDKKQGESAYHLAVPEKDIISLLVIYKESFFDTMVDRAIEMWAFR
ncbi:MAG: winged helix-turn-helix transcriptional regulator [Nanoarchaeota archaeon]